MQIIINKTTISLQEFNGSAQCGPVHFVQCRRAKVRDRGWATTTATKNRP